MKLEVPDSEATKQNHCVSKLFRSSWSMMLGSKSDVTVLAFMDKEGI